MNNFSQLQQHSLQLRNRGKILHKLLNISIDDELIDIQNDLKNVQKTFFKLTKGIDFLSTQIEPTFVNIDDAIFDAQIEVRSIRMNVFNVTNKVLY